MKLHVNWNFLGGGDGIQNKNLRGGSMDIFWNCEFQGSPTKPLPGYKFVGMTKYSKSNCESK